MYDDDKYAKAASQTQAGTGWLMHPAGTVRTKVAGSSPLSLWKAWGCVLGATFAIWTCAGGRIFEMQHEDLIGVVSCIFETSGLISIAYKIQKNGSVAGISGNAMILFFLSYILREVETFMSSHFVNFSKEGALIEILQLMSLPVLGFVIRAIYMTHRATYQEELDKLKTPHLIVACLLVSFVLRPFFQQGWAYSYWWTVSFYVDVLALLPQVVMMAYDTEKIKAPIANFVAATAFSRLVDLFFWYYRFDLGEQGYIWGWNYSGWLIVFFHFVNLAIVADFMYYYVRAKVTGAAFSDDLDLDMC